MKNIKDRSTILNVSVEDLNPKDKAFNKLDRRFRWSQIPIIGRLFGKGYVVIENNDKSETKNSQLK